MNKFIAGFCLSGIFVFDEVDLSISLVPWMLFCI
jgi:hypothetical protein